MTMRKIILLKIFQMSNKKFKFPISLNNNVPITNFPFLRLKRSIKSIVIEIMPDKILVVIISSKSVQSLSILIRNTDEYLHFIFIKDNTKCIFFV